MKNLLIITAMLFTLGCDNGNDSDMPTPNPQDTVTPTPPPVTGTAMFYIDPNAVDGDYWRYGFKVYINNKYYGSTNTFFMGWEPNCGDWNAVNYNDTAKAYYFHIIKLDGGADPHYDGSVVILADSCKKIALKNQRTF